MSFRFGSSKVESKEASAIIRGDLNTCKQLINKDNVNDSIGEDIGTTALFIACKYRSKGQVAIVEFLLAFDNIEVNMGKIWETPLINACINGNIEVVKLLLKCKDIKTIEDQVACKTAEIRNLVQDHIYKNPETCNQNYKPRLLIAEDLVHALDNCDLDRCKQLINKDNVNDKDEIGRTALYSACNNGYTKIVEMILKCENVDVNYNGSGFGFGFGYGLRGSALKTACECGHIEIVKLLLAHNDIEIDTGILNCHKTNEIRKLIQNHKVKDLPTPATFQFHNANKDMVSNNRTASGTAQQPTFGNPQIPNSTIQMPKISTTKTVDVLNPLLEKFINEKDYDNVELVLQYSTSLVSEEKCTPLVLAIKNGDLEMCDLLLENGANINLVDSNYKTGLMIAIEHKKEDIAASFINRKGVLLNSMDNGNNNALQLGIMNGCSIELMESLIKKEPLIFVNKNKDGLSALDIAFKLKLKEFVRFLYGKQITKDNAVEAYLENEKEMETTLKFQEIKKQMKEMQDEIERLRESSKESKEHNLKQ